MIIKYQWANHLITIQAYSNINDRTNAEKFWEKLTTEITWPPIEAGSAMLAMYRRIENEDGAEKMTSWLKRNKRLDVDKA